MKINESAGWIAMWNGKKCEIKKDEAKDLWGAKQLAIRKLGVPKSRVGELAIDVAFEDDEDGVSNAQFEELKEEKDIEVKDVEKMAELEPGDEVEVTKEMDDVFDKSLEMAKEFDEEPKLETFEEKIDFLVKDEDEAIAGYDKVLALLGEEDANAIEQLTHLKEEEIAHRDFLLKLKEDKSAIYSHEEEVKVEEPVEVTNIEVEEPIDDVIDDAFVDESYDDDFGFNHVLDEEHEEEAIDWDCLDDEREVKEEKHVCEKCGKEVCECDKKIEEEEHAHTGHIKAKKPIELLARVEK